MRFQESAYGSAAASPPPALFNVLVKDRPGDMFLVFSDNRILVASGVAKDKVYDARSPIGMLMIANLVDVPGNREKIEKVLSPERVRLALEHRASQPPIPSAPASAAQAAEAQAAAAPVERPVWLVPAAILGFAAAIGAAVVFWPRDR